MLVHNKKETNRWLQFHITVKLQITDFTKEKTKDIIATINAYQ